MSKANFCYKRILPIGLLGPKLQSRNRRPSGNIVTSHLVLSSRFSPFFFPRRVFPLRRYFRSYPAACARTSNRKGDDGFSKMGSYFFFPPSRKSKCQRWRTACLSNSGGGGLNEEGANQVRTHTQWIRKRSNFSSSHVAHFYSSRPLAPLPPSASDQCPTLTFTTPVRPR